MSRLANFAIAWVVVMGVGFVLDLLEAHHAHHCPACGRRAEHFDPECTEHELVLCPACGGVS